MQEAIRTTVWGSQGLTYRTLSHADMEWRFTQTEGCDYVNSTYTNTHLQPVYKCSLQTATETGHRLEKKTCKTTCLSTHTCIYIQLSCIYRLLDSRSVWGHSPDSFNQTGTLSCSQESLMSLLCYRQQAHISENIPQWSLHSYRRIEAWYKASGSVELLF